MPFSFDAVPLGASPSTRRPVYHNWETDPCLVIAGGAGTGKSVALENLVTNAVTQLAEVVIGSPYPLPQSPAYGLDAESLVSGIPAVMTLLDEAASEAARRLVLMKSHRSASFFHLPAAVRPRRMVVALEELAGFTHVPGAADMLNRKLRVVAETGRAAGVNLVLVSQRSPEAGISRQNSATLLMGRSSEEARRLAFRNPATAPLVGGGHDWGRGVYEGAAGAVEVQVPFFR